MTVTYVRRTACPPTWGNAPPSSVNRELVTNAVTASSPDDEFIAVRLAATGETVVVEVWSRPNATGLRALHPADDSETGRGLALVEALATRWDAYPAASGGVVVRAQFPAPILLPPGADRDATPLPTREAQPVPEPLRAPPASPLPDDLSVREYSTDPAVVARVAERLRALDPWHEHPNTDKAALTPARSTSSPDTHEEHT